MIRAQDVQIGAVTGRTGQRQWRDGIFAQDDYKIRPNLTVNLGLRWEFDQPIYEVNNKEANINMDTKQIIYAGVGGNSRALYDPTYTQFQPRVGFAYQPTARTVVRAGYGISSYVEGTGANLRLTQNPPFHTDFEEQTAIAPSLVEGAYSPGVFYQASNGFPTTQGPATTFYVWPKDFKPSVTQEFSLTAEYELNSTASFQAGYVGILGSSPYRSLLGQSEADAEHSSALCSNIVGDGGVIKITQTESASNYNGLQAVYRQRSQGWSRTDRQLHLLQIPHRRHRLLRCQQCAHPAAASIISRSLSLRYAVNEWGPAGTDTHHNISVSGVYELPFGKGKLFGSSWNYATNSLLGGWKLSGADVYYSGFPVTVASPAHYSNSVNAYGGAARPNQPQPVAPRPPIHLCLLRHCRTTHHSYCH